MKNYYVEIEERNRADESPAACEPMYSWEFDTEEEASKFFEKNSKDYLVSAYSGLTWREKKTEYFEAVLFEKDEDGDVDYISIVSVGKDYKDDYKKLYLVKKANRYQLWTVENRQGEIIKRSLTVNKDIDFDEEIDDYDWYENQLTDDEYNDLFNNVKVLNERWAD